MRHIASGQSARASRLRLCHDAVRLTLALAGAILGVSASAAAQVTVTTAVITGISATQATGGGTVTSLNSVSARGVCWSTAWNPTTAASHSTDGSESGTFTSALTSLQPSTTYHVRAYAVVVGTTYYGSDRTFVTPAAQLPSVTTAIPGSLASSSATGGGSIGPPADPLPTERGVCWNTGSNPTTANVHTHDGAGTGTFTSIIGGLVPGTTYHARAYAKTPLGTYYGADVSFTTLSVTLTTIHVFDGSDGYLVAGLMEASDGMLYGTTYESVVDGGYHNGVVFRSTRDGVVTVLHAFAGGSDGAHPSAALVQGADGNLYGTTVHGGAADVGTIFRVMSDDSVEILHAFAGPDGAGPSGRLVQASDGNFYGTTEGGGASGFGTVFRITPDGTYTVVHSFGGTFDASQPSAGLIQALDGNLYGTSRTSANGTGGGTVFGVRPDGVVIVGAYFSWVAGQGTCPNGPLLQGPDGRLYGTTADGGAAGVGTVFAVGATGSVTNLHEFAGADGRNPSGGLLMGSDGNMYGVARESLYAVTPDGAFSVLHTFTGWVGPVGELVQMSDGTIYGTTGFTLFRLSQQVGTSLPSVTTSAASAITTTSATSGGTIYSEGTAAVTERGVCWSTSASPTIANSHTSDGVGEGPFTRVLSGLAHSTTYHLRAYATSSVGTAYGEDRSFSTAVPVLPSVDGTTVAVVTSVAAVVTSSIRSDGGAPILNGGVCWSPSANPTTQDTCWSGPRQTGSFSARVLGLSPYTTYHIRAYARNDAGTAYGPESVFVTSVGTVTFLHPFAALEFKGRPDGYQPVAALIWGPDGNLYGTTNSGGAYTRGTVFSTTPSGETTVLHSFAGGSDGANPAASLVLGADGYFYGTTRKGGPTDNGTVFRMTLGGQVTILHAFGGGAGGKEPYGSLVQGTDGMLYGTTLSGGTSDWGTVFRITVGGELTVLHAFALAAEGGWPRAALVEVSEGIFYGTASGGGTANRGTVFRITSAGALTVVHAFAGSGDGWYPRAPLTLGTDGNLYGTTWGSSSGPGTVFRLGGPSGYSVLCFFEAALLLGDSSNADLGGVYSGLIQAGDGNFYGTTSGENAGSGTVFRLSPAGTLSVLHAFGSALPSTWGGGPKAALLEGADGTLYGTTAGGAGLGSVFRVRLETAASLPTVTTTSPEVTTPSTASTGGFVVSDGGAAVTARGVCWGPSPAPTIADSKTTNGTGDGIFSSDLFELEPGTVYHLRAFATNAVGTAYGADIEFTATVSPQAYAVVPPTGPGTGGTTITVTGSGFVSGATVSMGGAPAATVNVWSATTLTAVAPPHATGTISISVTNPDGQSASLVDSFSYTGQPADVALGSVTQVYSGAPRPVTATTIPIGLLITFEYVGTGGTAYGPTPTPPTNAGTYTVTATVNDVNYSGTATATLVVSKVTPVVTWATPAPITHGTPLGAAQLNATATVPGTFAYTPPAGTVLNAGTGQTLSVTFTPTDTANCTMATAVVAIDVKALLPTFTDATLVAGVTVKAAHLTELRQAVELLRLQNGLVAPEWTDAAIVPGVTTVKAIHLLELRTALAAVYTAAGRTAPSYTHATVTTGSTVITVVDIAELRAAILAIW